MSLLPDALPSPDPTPAPKHVTHEQLSAFAPFFVFGLGMATPAIHHLKSGRVYELLYVVIREHDCVPCGIYREWPGRPIWARPLVELLDATRWSWGERDAPLKQDLQTALTKYEALRSA